MGAACLLACLFSSAAAAQSFEASVHLAASQWSEFNGSEPGLGGRFTWKPTSLLGVDAGLTWYPSDFPSQGVAFSSRRVEGLFGVTVGPRLNRIRPFVKAAGGFLRTAAAPEPFACITIFPPPLSCLMAAGHTMPAFEIGGGLDVSASSSTFIRVDVTDRVLKYPGPSFGRDFDVNDGGFFGHALRLTVAGGLRF